MILSFFISPEVFCACGKDLHTVDYTDSSNHLPNNESLLEMVLLLYYEAFKRMVKVSNLSTRELSNFMRPSLKRYSKFMISNLHSSMHLHTLILVAGDGYEIPNWGAEVPSHGQSITGALVNTSF